MQKREWKKFLRMVARRELYEIAWNERERKAKPEIYQKKYFQALKFAILFQEREYTLFLEQREKQYRR